MSPASSGRLAGLAACHVVAALVATALAPLWLILLGPLLLGVPHVATDVRVLVLRRRPAPGAVFILLPLALMTLLRVVATVGGPSSPRLEVGLGLAAVAGGIGAAQASGLARLLLLLALGGAAGLLLGDATLTTVGFAHAHNFVAFAIFLGWFRGEGSRWPSVAVAGLFLGCVALIASGALDALAEPAFALGLPRTGLATDRLVGALAPGLDAGLARRLVLVYAFAQAVHYSVWVHLIPVSEKRPGGFLAGLRADFGDVGLACVAVAALALPLAGCADAGGARQAYLSLVLFHGWLELAVFASILVHRFFPIRPPVLFVGGV